MLVKGITDEDFVNYKKPSMYIAMPKCSFKCDRENGCSMCQNSSLAQEPDISVPIKDLVRRYIDNPITKAVVFGGLEPFDTPDALVLFITCLREQFECDDDVVIYTGYLEEELELTMGAIYHKITQYPNIIIKFGRFRPYGTPRFDEVLGVKLVSSNQYGKRFD
jgi:hypothetical protein